MQTTEEVNKASTVSPVPNNVRMGELGTTGLVMSDGKVFEDTLVEFQWPNLIYTCKMMEHDSSIYAAMNAIKSIIRTVEWEVFTPDAEEDTEEVKQREEFIKQCMHDMEHSWGDFVNEALSMLVYGFSVHEKVFKQRKGLKGKYQSKFDDGKWGWAKLPIRAQDTIRAWRMTDDGRRIKTIEQDVRSIMNRYIGGKTTSGLYKIPYNKVLHFRHDSYKNNPEGSTPLRACYVPWKYKTTIEEFEAIGVSRDLNGMPYIGIPPEYMSEDASEDKKMVYSYFQGVIRNMHMNEQAGLIFPRFIDPETKTDLFEFKLISVDGKKQFETDKIINRYENKILMAFMADILKMGQTNSGSFALSDNKQSMLQVGIEAILVEILEIVNRDLITNTAILNGWDLSKPLPKIGFAEINDRDLDKLGSFIQRCVSVGAIEVDQNMSDELRRIANLPKTDADKPVRNELNPDAKSEAGRGFKTPGNGNSTTVGGSDATVSNAANAS